MATNEPDLDRMKLDEVFRHAEACALQTGLRFEEVLAWCLYRQAKRELVEDRSEKGAQMMTTANNIDMEEQVTKETIGAEMHLIEHFDMIRRMGQKYDRLDYHKPAKELR